MDTNKDGLISKDELVAFFRSNSNRITQETIEKLPKVNPNDNKILNQNVNHKVPLSAYNANVVNKVEDIFRKYDDNNTGQLDYYELSKYLKHELGNKYSYFEFMEKMGVSGLVSKEDLAQFITKFS